MRHSSLTSWNISLIYGIKTKRHCHHLFCSKVRKLLSNQFRNIMIFFFLPTHTIHYMPDLECNGKLSQQYITTTLEHKTHGDKGKKYLRLMLRHFQLHQTWWKRLSLLAFNCCCNLPSATNIKISLSLTGVFFGKTIHSKQQPHVFNDLAETHFSSTQFGPVTYISKQWTD